MALELRPKNPNPGQPQKWLARFQIPTGRRKPNGKPEYYNYRKVIGERGKMAKRQAQEIHDKLKQKVMPDSDAGVYLIESPILSEFASEFIKHKKEVDKIRAWDRYVYAVKQLINFFGSHIKLSDINPKRVDEYKAHRLNDVTPGTVNRELQCLRAMINLAAKWNQFKGENPVSKAGILQEVREEPVAVTYEEEDKLLAALHPNIARICEFALNTGMRIEEILYLDVKALDDNPYPKAKIEATEQKGKRFREVPLNPRALELIDKALIFAQKYNNKPTTIFLSSKGKQYSGHDSIYPTVIRACKIIGIRKINPHLLRHTFISRAIESGKVDPIAVKEIVGHANLKTLLRYVHLKDSKLTAVNAVMRERKEDKSAVNE